MAKQIKNVFISHIHEDDEGIDQIRSLTRKHGMTVRNGSVTSDSPNSAEAENYIKYQILAPRIKWASVLAVYVSPDTQHSWWVDWEIEYAHKQGKRVIGVWAHGARDCELPKALDDYADAVVGWHGESIIDAINGISDKWYKQDGAERGPRNIKRYSC